MTRSTIATTLTAILVVALVAGAAPAAADHDGGDSGLGDAVSAPANAIDFVLGGAFGLADRASYAINGPDDDAATNRDDIIQEFNEHNETLIQYANSRDVHEGDVLQIDCTIEGDTESAYIVADYNSTSGEYESAEAVASTDRTVDHTVGLQGAACDNAASELDTFVDEYAEPGEDVDSRYAGRMASKYKGNVDEPFTGGDD